MGVPYSEIDTTVSVDLPVASSNSIIISFILNSFVSLSVEAISAMEPKINEDGLYFNMACLLSFLR